MSLEIKATEITAALLLYVELSRLGKKNNKKFPFPFFSSGLFMNGRPKKKPGFLGDLKVASLITQHTGPTSLRPTQRTKQLWLSVLLKDTSAATGQAGIRTHILTTPELESSALDHSATTLHNASIQCKFCHQVKDDVYKVLPVLVKTLLDNPSLVDEQGCYSVKCCYVMLLGPLASLQNTTNSNTMRGNQKM